MGIIFDVIVVTIPSIKTRNFVLAFVGGGFNEVKKAKVFAVCLIIWFELHARAGLHDNCPSRFTAKVAESPPSFVQHSPDALPSQISCVTTSAVRTHLLG